MALNKFISIFDPEFNTDFSLMIQIFRLLSDRRFGSRPVTGGNPGT